MLAYLESRLPINNIGDVTAVAEKLHHPLSSPSHLRPTGFCLRVLLQSSNLVAVESKVHLSQAYPGECCGRDTVFHLARRPGILDEDLPPEIDPCLLEGKFHRTLWFEAG